LGGALTLQSGGPFTVMAGRDNSLTAVGYDRPDLVGDTELADRPRTETILRYFNTDAFRANATGTYGNTGRNTQIGPGQFFLDVSLSKTFPLWETHSLQFRVDAFNLPNYPNFNEPNATLTASAFGQITGASSGRIMQLSLKYAF